MLQLVNHCKKALSNETLLLLHPLGDFSHYVTISAWNLLGIHVNYCFIGVYVRYNTLEISQWL